MIIIKLIGFVLASVLFAFIWAIEHVDQIKDLTNQDSKAILQITFGIFGGWILITSFIIN